MDTLLKTKIRAFRGSVKNWRTKLHNLQQKHFQPYDSQEFKETLSKLGIMPGDCVFVMHSQDKIHLHSGQIISPGVILQDVLDYLGSAGTVLVLSFPLDRLAIGKREKKFDARKTPTESGILAEILRRKKNSVRSLNPVFSAVAYGHDAKFLCESHHLSPYPFDEFSPYRRIIERGGKYLGIGVGFEAFVPCHMVEDCYKENFAYQIYEDEATELIFVDQSGMERCHSFFLRNQATSPRTADTAGYFKTINIPYTSEYTHSGVKLFSFLIQDFLDSTLELYDSKRISVWNVPRLGFKLRHGLKRVLINMKLM
jgi:aminoglycoside N3'-acetyltransferase